MNNTQKKKAGELNVKIIYLPSANKFYTKDFTTSVSIGNIGNILCGESRPNHFNGVTTVLTKLFFLTVFPQINLPSITVSISIGLPETVKSKYG